MGANTFITTGPAGELNEVFERVADASRWEDGHSYSGAIGMKDSVILLDTRVLSTEKEAVTYATDLLNADDPRISDKWGPAGAIQWLGGWVFVGWASS